MWRRTQKGMSCNINQKYLLLSRLLGYNDKNWKTRIEILVCQKQ